MQSKSFKIPLPFGSICDVHIPRSRHYVNASCFWQVLWHESPTVAGCHPTDEGGELITEFYTKMIPQWIAGPGR